MTITCISAPASVILLPLVTFTHTSRTLSASLIVIIGPATTNDAAKDKKNQYIWQQSNDTTVLCKFHIIVEHPYPLKDLLYLKHQLVPTVNIALYLWLA